MRDIAITAGVNITLPVIAQAGSAAVREGELPSGSQSVQALWATRALRPPQKTVSHGGTRSWFGVIGMQLHLVCRCATVVRGKSH